MVCAPCASQAGCQGRKQTLNKMREGCVIQCFSDNAPDNLARIFLSHRISLKSHRLHAKYIDYRKMPFLCDLHALNIGHKMKWEIPPLPQATRAASIRHAGYALGTECYEEQEGNGITKDLALLHYNNQKLFAPKGL